MRPCPDVGTLRVPADQVSSDREPLEVFGLEGHLAIGGRQLRLGIAPGLPPERRPASIARGGPGHGTRHRKMWLRVSRTLRVTVRSGTQSPMP
jgi:hypothetical protein